MNGIHVFLLTAALLGPSILTCAESDAVRFRADRPTRLFPCGQPVTIQVTAPGPQDISWQVMDWRGNQVASGAGGNQVTVELPDLPHGYYELLCQTAAGRGRYCFGVVTDHSAQDPPSTRLNVDAAACWLVDPASYETLAQMLRTIGVGWVRERFGWSDTEPEKGKVDWKQYDLNADVWHNQGIRVYQIFHDSPGWSHPGNDRTRNPEDLREVYAFTRRLAEHFRGRVQAWEVWNEPDIGFWPDLGDTYAGLAKAAYLGFKAGDPQVMVLLGSFCRGYCPFDDSLFEAGIRDYFDVFNWHIYNDPAVYPATLHRYLELLGRHDCANRPVWLTEAGIAIRATEPQGELNAEDERRQAEFIPRSFAYSLAAGTDRHFFFVYPYYLEGEIQFGALRKDLSPRPAFVAIAAAVDILGEARYLGRYDVSGADECTALAFDSGQQRVLVIWAGRPQEVTLEVGARSVEVADVVGRRTIRSAPGGKVTLEVGPSAQYVMGLGDAALDHIGGDVRPPGRLPTNHPDPVVVRGQARVDNLDKGADCYVIGEDSFGYTVEVCNLNPDTPAQGTVVLELPEGWRCEPQQVPVSLEPMGRAVCEFTITPGRGTGRTYRVRVLPTFQGASPQPSVSHFRYDPLRITPTSSFDIGLDEAARWVSNISGNGQMTVHPGLEGGVHSEIRFTAAGDRWCYPKVTFDPPADFAAYDGIAFEFRCHADDPNTRVRLQLWEPGGAAYVNNEGWPARQVWTAVVCPFSALAWGSYSTPDSNARLDLDAIQTLMIGVNTSSDHVTLEVRNLRLVKLGD